MNRVFWATASLIVLAAGGLSASLSSQDMPAGASPPDAPRLAGSNVQYSPYTEYDFPDMALFGDTHVHTSYSTDAGMVGNNLGPDEAYRFAKGEVVISSNGTRGRLEHPLDFLVIADHAENLGFAPMVKRRDPELLKTEFGRKIADLIGAGQGGEAYNVWGTGMMTRKDPLAGTSFNKIAWNQLTEAAERHNQPGRFTALIGFEWTSSPNGDNLHRNVVFRDGKAKADQIVPLSQYDTQNVEDLWSWMETYQRKTGGRVIDIPHNGNLSSGLMFDDTYFDGRRTIDAAYALRRAAFEPIYEITQMKGDGETHPALSPTDEFADFERWDVGGFGTTKRDAKRMLPKEYAREALKRGLAYQARIGANPFKFGVIGSTDTHTSLSTTEENNFFGKASPAEPTKDPVRFQEVIVGRYNPPDRQIRHYRASASGLAGVWARSNTREAIWDAFARKEVFATTGTRIRVRVFAGYGFSKADLDRPDFARSGYAKGVPMGADLQPARNGRSPGLLIRAIKDPDGANLDRIQVVKGWVDARGNSHEKVYDAAWSGNRKIGKNGKLPAVGNTVDIANATYRNSIGSAVLQVYWTDPSFNPREHAFYYVRVLEIPTPRWTTIDAKVFGVKRPTDVPASIQERAYTSPIWYTPARS